MAYTKIGKITHFFDKIAVAVIQTEASDLVVGDQILVGEEGVGFNQTVDSMQVDHQPVTTAAAGTEVALKLTGPAKEGDNVYKLSV